MCSSQHSVSQAGNVPPCSAGQDSREVALEVVRPRVHPLPQVLQQERCLELRYHHVGGLQLRAETLQGEAGTLKGEAEPYKVRQEPCKVR